MANSLNKQLQCEKYMRNENELGNWANLNVQLKLSAHECVMIHESLYQFIKESKDSKSDYFKDEFTNTIDKHEFSIAHEIFNELIKEDAIIQKYLNNKSEDNSKINSSDSSDKVVDIGALFTLKDEEVEFMKHDINFNIKLRAIIVALKVHSKFSDENSLRVNESYANQEFNDWSPPSNFANGTDAEREIWEDFKVSQQSRK